MRVIRPDEFKKLAQDVVNEYLKRSVPLVDGLAKTALDNALNPEQVKNLVQLANTMAHLTLFDQKNDGDKIVEFDPADPASVIKKVFVNGEPATSDALESTDGSDSDMFGDLGDVLGKVKDALRGSGSATSSDSAVPAPEQESTCEQPQDSGSGSSPAKRQMLIIKIRKVASDLEDKQHQTAFNYKEELDKMAGNFAKLYGSDFKEFEKDAYALRGELAAPIIADLRHCLRLATPTEDSFAKTARVVDSKTKEMRGLDRLIKLSDEWQTLHQARTHLKESVGEYL